MNPGSKEENEKQQQQSLSLQPDILLEKLSVNLTKLDLTNKKIVSETLENLKFPENLEILILSQNNLTELTESLRNLEKLKKLDVSYNKIVFFDDSPTFYNTIEHLDLSNNNLKGPPYWVWSENPKNLQYLNLSINDDITCCLTDAYYQELIQYTTPLAHLNMYNCRLQNHLELVGTFVQLKSLKLGAKEFSLSIVNFIEKFPKKGLEKCCDVEVIDLSNTKIYTIDTNINIYKNLTDLNLSLNNISYLPSQLCDLEKLQLCVLSFNELIYLPEGIEKLKNLKELYLDHNQLCMLPDNLNELINLATLDLYSNHLYEIPEIEHVLEIDIAQNYCDEPEGFEYGTKKEKLRERLEITDKRLNGPAEEDVRSPEESHSDNSVDEWNEQEEKTNERASATPEKEDWDSDDNWVPHPPRPYIPLETPWNRFLKQKQREGNFCPSDMHVMSVADKVKLEKMGKPKFTSEVIGQFDDFSDENS